MITPTEQAQLLSTALGIAIAVAVILGFAWGYTHLGPLFSS